MKRTNAPPIPEGLRIELYGEQEWKAVMQVFEDAGWLWINGDKPTVSTNYYKNTLPIIITKSDKKIARGATIRPDQLTAAQFLQQYQGTIEYEAGDWVVLINDGCFYDHTQRKGDIVQILQNDNATYHWEYKTTKGFIGCPGLINTYIRPATPEEIESVTKPHIKKPEPYIWDGDVLPDEYWVENPWPGIKNTEFVQLFNKMREGNCISGRERWYRVKDSKLLDSHRYSHVDTELPIVSYELWKSILEQPASEVELVKERMFKKGDRIKVVKGIYEGCLGVISDVGLGSLYWADLDSGDKYVVLFSGETGTSVDMVHYVDEPAVPKWSIVTTDGVTVYSDTEIWSIDKQVDNKITSWKIDHSYTHRNKDRFILFSTFEAAEEYISKQRQLAGRKWKVGDRYCNPVDVYSAPDIPNTEGWYIRQLSKDTYKAETVDGEDKMGRYSYTVKEIDDYINRRVWVPYIEKKEKNDNQTNNQTTNNDKDNKQQSQQDSCISNIENSRYPGTTLDLRADQETISTGSRSTGTSLRCTGQPELFASKYSSYPKGSGYCEEV